MRSSVWKRNAMFRGLVLVCRHALWSDTDCRMSCGLYARHVGELPLATAPLAGVAAGGSPRPAADPARHASANGPVDGATGVVVAPPAL